ncbi:hypothetical protein SprV_0301113200 [Sparganum proliferum]
MQRLIRIPGILFRIPGRVPTPRHQPTASWQAPELGARYRHPMQADVGAAHSGLYRPPRIKYKLSFSHQVSFSTCNGGVNVTVTGGRWESGRLERAKQWRLDKLANDGADRRREMIVAVVC